ncbi:esterase/lipase family protein [Kitasatospora azatica]|uniref:esterase/lipase family protein n=1 Tax=Kitasatospora azatica TaxID=58347 RepID=UPI000AC18479|nr:hypothetical protein [Kitasatospora azatica]
MMSIFRRHSTAPPAAEPEPDPEPDAATPAPAPQSAPGRRLPVIYVRGFAGGAKGIDKQVDDPFYGFNDGSTHIRVGGDGTPQYYQFESPLLRLFAADGYQPLVSGDPKAYLESQQPQSVPPETLWIHRFYDSAADTFGKGAAEFNIERAAEDLYDLVELVRSRTGAPKVFLVAHSMGGLVCRSMIQKISYLPKDGVPRTPGKDLVDKLFTYGTPHGGITFEVGGGLLDEAMEVLGPVGSDIFSPELMYGYLWRDAHWGEEAPDGWRPTEIPPDEFPADRIFCLIGTDPADYGLSRKVVGPRSDGLVAIENAYVRGAHRAFVHRSHSGRYGLVNSEEGYQNLRRFLFGKVKVEVALTGLDPVPAAAADGAVWQAEVQLSVRGLPVVLDEQLAAHYCPVQLSGRQDQAAPVPLADVFLLDPATREGSSTVAPSTVCRYALHLRVMRLEERHGLLFWRDHLAQAADWDDILVVDVGRLASDPPEAMLAWAAWNSMLPGAIADYSTVGTQPLATQQGTVSIPLPLSAAKLLGDQAALRLSFSHWS